jgi:hypothetical protein
LPENTASCQGLAAAATKSHFNRKRIRLHGKLKRLCTICRLMATVVELNAAYQANPYAKIR